MVDEKGNISGYYYDLMNILQENQQFKYQFVISTLSEGLKKLVNGETDIMLGIPIKMGQIKDIIFNYNRTNTEIFGVFSNKDISFEDVYILKNLKLGIVEEDINAERVIALLKSYNIHFDVIYAKDYDALERLLKQDKVDLIVDNRCKENTYFMIYQFIGRDVYIAGHKESLALLNRFDQAMEQEEKHIRELQDKYFGTPKTSYSKIVISAVSILLIIGSAPLINKKRIQTKIKSRMMKNQYTLYYQPIYNPRTNTIVGFEGLLRLINKKNKLIPPSKIIPEIEKNNMLFNVSLWILEKAIKDYNRIKNAKFICAEDFYLSINISLKELENDYFVEKAISLLKESNLGNQRICLEIVERFKMDDMEKITQNIKQLKQAGFKLAIDDFGVEYSNLDIFQKLDVDIIKVDKMLIDGIGKDTIKEEIVLFISKLAHIADRSIVLEGIEEANQDEKIKKMKNEHLYVQGYYYNKPISMERILNNSLNY